MDPCRGQVRLAVGAVRRGGDDPLLGIRGVVEVRDGGDLLVSLDDLPVIELAEQMDRWLIGVAGSTDDFVYSSRQHEEPGILYFRRGDPCWRVGSIWAEGERELEASLRGVAVAAADYVADVAGLVRPLGIDLARFLEEQRG